jgi:uncharacterized cupin superfamily protein
MPVMASLSERSGAEFSPMNQDNDDPAGEVSAVDFTAAAVGKLSAGLWRCPTMKMDMPLSGDEALFIVEGRLVVEAEGGERVELGPGDIVAVAQHTQCSWTISEPLKAFYAIVS